MDPKGNPAPAARSPPEDEPVCALDYRYGRAEVKGIFSERGKLAQLLAVEAALARAHARAGNIPKKAADEITRKATLEHVTPQRVREIEARIQHDLMAVVVALTEACEGQAGRYVHLGATSYDIIDTANALMMRRGLDLIEAEIARLERTLATLARTYRDTPCAGRTHGQHAVPTTFGYKMAAFLLEAHRHRTRLNECRDRCLVGKMLGAVGTGAAFGPNALTLEGFVADELGIPMEPAPTQIVARDRYNEVFAHLASLVTSVERFATEVRNLQRNEIGEAAEGFDAEAQVGSSTMAQKQNPVACEKVTGLARIARAFLAPAYENAVQWHERDLSNSSGERFIVPHIFILAHECVATMADVFQDLRVYPEAMRRNLVLTPTITAEAVVIALAERGLGRQEAHEVVRRASIGARTREQFREALLGDKEVARLIKPAELDKLLDPLLYLGKAPELVDRVLELTGHAT